MSRTTPLQKRPKRFSVGSAPARNWRAREPGCASQNGSRAGGTVVRETCGVHEQREQAPALHTPIVQRQSCARVGTVLTHRRFSPCCSFPTVCSVALSAAHSPCKAGAISRTPHAIAPRARLRRESGRRWKGGISIPSRKSRASALPFAPVHPREVVRFNSRTNSGTTPIHRTSHLHATRLACRSARTHLQEKT